MKKIICAYCGTKYDAEEPRCPSCGGPNTQETEPQAAPSEQGLKKPQTIQELRDFAAAHKLPLNKMRVHIGEDYGNPRAYGIFQTEDGSFVVYKNKADGSRSIRYRGPDEAHAVSELYLKMQELVRQQKARQAEKARQAANNRPSAAERSRSSCYSKKVSWLDKLKKNFWIYLIILAVCLGIWYVVQRNLSPKRGYYRYDNGYYYYQGSSWYHYSDFSDSWYPVSADSELRSNYGEYYQSGGYSDSYGVDDFSDSSYYDPGSYDRNNGWDWDDDDDDWDWDWGDDDWDWGGDDDWDWDDSDWDSDW